MMMTIQSQVGTVILSLEAADSTASRPVFATAGARAEREAGGGVEPSDASSASPPLAGLQST